MKKFLKVFSIALGSLFVLALVALGIVSWLLFTPERLTPIAQKQASKYLRCEVAIERAEISLVRRFPEAEIRLQGLTLVNPMPGAPCDTLLDVRSAVLRADIMALLKRRELLLSEFTLSGGNVCLFVDGDGNANYDIFPESAAASGPVSGEDDGFEITHMELRGVRLDGVALRYRDEQSEMAAEAVLSLAEIAGTARGSEVDIEVSAEIRNAGFATDSLSGGASFLSLGAKAFVNGETADFGSLSIRAQGLTAVMDGETMAENADLELDTSVLVGLEPLTADISSLTALLNGLPLSLHGTAAMDSPEKGSITADITYSLESWPLKKIAGLIPAKYAGYLDGITIRTGAITSSGNIAGVYSEDSMPLMDIVLELDGASGEYAAVPLALTSLDGGLRIVTDLKDDAKSFVAINSLKAATAGSRMNMSGTVRNLFSDMAADLSGHAVVSLEEFGPFIPDSLRIEAKGVAELNFDGSATVSQVEKMELDKIKFNGKLALTSFEANYDTIAVFAPHAEAVFSLPNRSPKEPSRSFVSAGITADRLDIVMGKSMTASLFAPEIGIESGDFRDTTHIPSFAANATFDSLRLEADMLSVTAAAPAIRVAVAPQRRNAEQPRFSMAYKGGAIAAAMGPDSFGLREVDFSADVAYNAEEEKPLLRFRPRGKLYAKGITASIGSLGLPLGIPTLDVGITPRRLTVNEASLTLGTSDFRLTGVLDNLTPYLRGDSILRGDFVFSSGVTDLDQLLALTSDIGDGEDTETTNSGGPYMVPRGTDITLRADIKKAILDGNAIREIEGGIFVLEEGRLVLDSMTMRLPGANAQLSGIYHSQRRNNIFTALDLHLLDVEIETLLQMIPALDTLMPMLRSFRGKGEFHMAADVSLDSLYRMKISTLGGSASLRGKDLVLLDGETFHAIARKLMFRNKERNIVDSLSAEFTVLKNYVYVFPFAVSMDRYGAVVGGRHGLDMDMDYNISLVKSLLPFRLAVNVSGTPENMRFRLTRNKYHDFTRPVWRGEVQNKQLELREMIRRALLNNIAIKDDGE